MIEIRLRHEALVDAINGQQGDAGSVQHRVAAELCYLQLRRICELLGIAALAAHNDLPKLQTNAFRDEYNGERIMRRLGQLSDHAFMVPLSAQRGADGMMHIADRRDYVVDRDEVRKIYSRCGSVLHAGTLADFLSGAERGYDMDEVRRWTLGIRDLLEQHMLVLPGAAQVLLVGMNDPETGGVNVLIAEPEGETVVDKGFGGRAS